MSSGTEIKVIFPDKSAVNLNKQHFKEAFKESSQVLIGAIIVASLVKLLSLAPFDIFKPFVALTHEFDVHATDARASLPVLALLIATIPIMFADNAIFEKFEQLCGPVATRTIKFLSHLILAAIGLGAPKLVFSIYSNQLILIPVAGLYLVGTLLMLLANGYSEKLTYSSRMSRDSMKLIAFILFLSLFYLLYISYKVELIPKY